MKTIAALLCGLMLGAAVPALADSQLSLSIRPFAMVTEQAAAATDTFTAVMGESHQTFWGGGVSVTQQDRYYLDLTASRFKQTGQRAFRTTSGDIFRLGIPLTATIVPFEITGGYRFHRWTKWHILPYAGGGIGFYKYKEESPAPFSDASENLDTSHAGAVLEGGVEIRLHRWIGAAVDVHYTHVPGILGAGGISKDVNENDLGGVSARFKVIVGR
jgi:hypothetical protein